MTSLDIAIKLELYFDCKRFGSVLIPKLVESDINDIDVSVPKESQIKVWTYLREKGYKKKDLKHTTRDGYDTSYSYNWIKEGQLPIHIVLFEKSATSSKFVVWDSSKIIASKIARASQSDVIQLDKIINKLKKKYKL